MNDVIGGRPPAWFRPVAVLALLWNLYGVFMYLVQVGLMGAGEPPAEPTPADATPLWVTAAFSIAVFAGALGALGLLLLKRWAGPLLILSLLAVLAWDVWVFLISDAAAETEGAPALVPIVVTVIAILLVWMASVGSKRGWLR